MDGSDSVGAVEDLRLANYRRLANGDLRRFNSLLRELSRQQWRLAPLLLNLAAQEATTVTLNAAMAGCAGASQWSQVLQVMRTFQSRSLQPSLVSFNLLLGAARWGHSLAVLDEMAMQRVACNTMVCNAGLLSCSSWRHSQQLLASLPQRQVEATVVTSNSAVSVHRTASWSRVLWMTRWAQPRVDAFGKSAAIAALGAAEDAGLWPWALRMMRGNVVSFNAALSCCEKCQEWQVGAQLLSVLQLESMAINVNGASALVAALAAFGRWASALQLLCSVAARRVRATVVSAGAAITAGANAAAWERCAELVAQGAARCLVVGDVGSSALCSGLERGQQWQAAGVFLASLGGGLRLSDFAFNAIMGCDRTPWEVSLDLWDLLQQRQIRSSEVSLGAAVKACEASYAWPCALAILPCGSSHLVAFNAALSAVAKAKQLQQLQLLLQMGRLKPSVITINTVLPCLGGEVSRESLWEEETLEVLDPEVLQRNLGIRPNLMTYNEATLLSESLGLCDRPVMHIVFNTHRLHRILDG